jgi:hypothetical protein
MKRQLLSLALCLGFIFSLEPVNVGINQPSHLVAEGDWNCISTFEDFLYQMVRIDFYDYDSPFNPPPFPWEMRTEIPEWVLNEIINTNNRDGIAWWTANLDLARTISEHTELWIHLDRHYIRYNTGSDVFSVFSTSPYDKNGKIYRDVQVKDLFETVTGQIFGVNYPEGYDTVWLQEVPLFSVFNEVEDRFEFYDVGLNFSAEEVGWGYVEMTGRYGVIISHSSSVIWIYQQQDGLFSYNLHDFKLRHYETSFDGIVEKMISTPIGFLIFGQHRGDTHKMSTLLNAGELLRYYPASQHTEEVAIPSTPWPDYGTLIYTDSGNLWIGIHGYLTKEGSWILKNPDSTTYIDLGRTSLSYNWAQPDLLFQSSNGYLWFTNDRGDTLGIEGTAWYDTETEKGCWFTTEPSSIVEDGEGNLWMLIEEKIYKYSLSE